jgi:hypothetical protein
MYAAEYAPLLPSQLLPQSATLGHDRVDARGTAAAGGNVGVHALVGTVHELRGALHEEHLIVREERAHVHRRVHHRVGHFVGEDAIVEEWRIAAVRRVRRREVRHVDFERDVRADAARTDRRGDPRERAARTVGEGVELDVDRIAVRLNAVILLDEVFGIGEPARLQAIEHGELVGIADYARAILAKNLLAVEARGAADAVDLRRELRDFLLERRAVRVAVGGIRGLHRELANALQGLGDRAQRTVRRLQHRNTIVGVAHG